MAGFRTYPRHSVIPIAGIALAMYYILVFLPLQRQADSLNAPLKKSWEKLAGSVGPTNLLSINFTQITNELIRTRQALTAIDTARSRALARIEFPSSVRVRMRAPFQLVEFQNERSKLMDELIALAQKQKLVVEPAVYLGFPEHTVEVRQPGLLWAELAMVESLTKSALACGIPLLHSLDVPLALTNAPISDFGLEIAEIPLQFEFTAPVSNAMTFVQSLPLRAEELKAAALPSLQVEKPPLFIEHLVMKKQAPEKPDEVRVSVRVQGFVVRE